MKTYQYKIIKILQRRLGKNILRYLLDFSSFGFWYIVASILALVINVLINYSLEPVEYGKYSYNRSILELAASLLTINIYASYLRFNVNGVSRVLKRLSIRITIIAAIFLTAILLYLTESLLALPFVFVLLYNERTYMARSIMDINSVSILRVGACIFTLMILYTFFALNFSISGDVVLMSLGLGYSLSVYFYNKKYEINEDDNSLSIKQILQFTIPSAAIIIVNWLINLSGQVFIKHEFGYEDVAHYAIAQRILSVIKMVSSMFMMFYPVVYFKEMSRANYTSVTKIRMYMIVFFIAITSVAFVFSKQIYFLMGASKYEDYIIYFYILLVSEFLFTVSSFYAQYLTYILKTHITLIICAIGAVINVSILSLCLKTYGVITAAYAVLFSNVVMSLLYYFLSYKLEKKQMTSNTNQQVGH